MPTQEPSGTTALGSRVPLLVANLETLDLEWVRQAGPFAAGMIATVKDADGNFVNVFGPQSGEEAQA
jgi:hypothetical protein